MSKIPLHLLKNRNCSFITSAADAATSHSRKPGSLSPPLSHSLPSFSAAFTWHLLRHADSQRRHLTPPQRRRNMRGYMEAIQNHFGVVMQHFRTHPTMEKVRGLGLGKMAVTAATSTILAPVVSDKFPTSVFHFFMIVGMLGSILCLWIGYFLEERRVGPVLQLMGVIWLMQWACLIMGDFLPVSMSALCWGLALFFNAPLLDIVLDPRRGAPVQPPPRVGVV